MRTLFTHHSSISMVMLLAALLFSFSASAKTIEPYNCRGYHFSELLQSIQPGEISLSASNRERSYFYDDDKGCPYHASCKQKPYLVSGDKVLIAKTEDGWSCVWYSGKRKDFIGWMSAANIKPPNGKRKVGIADWPGIWKRHGDKDGNITITHLQGEHFKVEGSAFWYGAHGNVHDGIIEDEGAIDGDLLQLGNEKSSDPCQVKMRLIDGLLVVADNAQCGGMNVRFDGVYQRKKVFPIKQDHLEESKSCDTIFIGRYTWGPEVDAFQPCGSKQSFWVSASSWVQEPLLDYYRSMAKQPYQSIYIEFRGHMLNEVVDGFAEDYDGLIRISEIRGKSATVPNTCQSP